VGNVYMSLIYSEKVREGIKREIRRIGEEKGENEAYILSKVYLMAESYEDFVIIVRILKDNWILTPEKIYSMSEVKEIIMDDVTGNLEIEDAKIKMLMREKSVEYIN
jgi:hypothetical protein